MKRIVIAMALVVAGEAADGIDAAARPASSGWFAEGGLGAVGFLPKVSTDARVGPALDLRFGRDVFSWLSIGVGVEASSHEARVPPPPVGEWFQLYRFGGDARIGGRFDTIAVFVEGGVGLAMISSNILSTVMITDPGERFSIAFQGGAGAAYQLENRHYAIGLALDGFIVPQFSTMTALAGRAYLRYTY